MHELLQPIIAWEIEIIVRIQAAIGGVAGDFFQLMSDLGRQSVYLLLLVVLYWGIDKRLAARLALLYVTSGYVNGLIKELAKIERPFQVSSEIVAGEIVRGYSFPSGHTQLAATVWPSLAYVYRRRWMAALAAITILLIGFSRLYLGVHYPHDVIGGLVIGLLWADLYRRTYPSVERQLIGMPLAVLVAGVILVPALANLSLASEEASPIAGAAMGLGLGYVFEERWIGLCARAAPWRVVLRLVVGAALTAAVFAATSVLARAGESILPGSVTIFVQFALVGLAITLLAPWAFVKLGLGAIRAPEDAHIA